jgi:hypothetical protein
MHNNDNYGIGNISYDLFTSQLSTCEVGTLIISIILTLDYKSNQQITYPTTGLAIMSRKILLVYEIFPVAWNLKAY